jgi:hypothetical protein
MEKGAKSRSAKSGKYKPVKKMKEIIDYITAIERLSAYLKNLYCSIIIYCEHNTSMCMCGCRA